jgi:RNA polymerase sigma factor (sigma-70 family)
MAKGRVVGTSAARDGTPENSATTGVSGGGPAAEFAFWVEPHLPAMARLAARLVPEADRDDVVQEALVRAWRRRTTYDEARGSVATWLLAIVAGCARRSRVRAPRDQPVDPHETAGAGTAADPDRDLDLERALRDLPRRERLAVALYYFLDLDTAETAAVMGCSPGTVKATLHHARARLRGRLEGGR